MLVGVRLTRVSPKVRPSTPNGARKPSKLLPNTTDASAMSPTNRPSVTMTALISGPFSTGRTMTRSTRPPSTKPLASAATVASTYESVRLSTSSAMNVVNIAWAPCPKLTMRVARKMSTRHSANAA